MTPWLFLSSRSPPAPPSGGTTASAACRGVFHSCVEKGSRRYSETARRGEQKKRKREKEKPATAEVADYESAAMIFTVRNTMRNDERSEKESFGPK